MLNCRLIPHASSIPNTFIDDPSKPGPTRSPGPATTGESDRPARSGSSLVIAVWFLNRFDGERAGSIICLILLSLQ
jgi:hypothetical protein